MYVKKYRKKTSIQSLYTYIKFICYKVYIRTFVKNREKGREKKEKEKKSERKEKPKKDGKKKMKGKKEKSTNYPMAIAVDRLPP